jgi:hypothetical protein
MRQFEYTADQIKSVIKRMGYKWFTNSRGYDLNLFGVRTENNGSNKFDDWLGFIYDTGSTLVMAAFPATTDPGLYWLQEPMRVEGAAILVPNQYPKMWEVGLHKRTAALRQIGKVDVYRDDDRDKYLDMDPESIQRGLFGINMHRAGGAKASTLVGKWSAGCQVVADPIQHAFLMETCRRQVSMHGYQTFTYTLLTEEQIDAVL